MKDEIQARFREGLWQQNAALVQLLGLCPLLAVSTTVTHALGLGLATTLVLICTNGVISLCRHVIPRAVRIPVFVVVIAAVVTLVQLAMQAFAWPLYQSLGIFIPLIVTNCIVLGRAEAYAARHAPSYALLDGLTTGLGSTFALLLLGALREILGNGTLFAGAEQLLGPWARSWQITVLPLHTPFLLAILPPGAFIGLGLLLAGKAVIDRRLARPSVSLSLTLEKENQR